MRRMFALVLGVLTLGGLSAQAAGAKKRLYGTEETVINRIHAINQAEIQLGQAGQQRATDPAIRDYATMLVDDHVKADQELAQLARERNITLQGASAQSLPLPVRKEFAKQNSQLKDLRNLSGQAFEQEFLTQAIRNHDSALYFMRAAQNDVWSEPVKAMIGRNIPLFEHHRQVASDLASRPPTNTALVPPNQPPPTMSGTGQAPVVNPDQR